ncbi:uncharacterized protein LOC109137264 [Larimichthys crocea]|uniref:uncharacterized protein LOC109137264 n=1 Tax=Larimichthys crocea TaxID=215358 RepID=UPI000F5FD5E3|nr:uncharacterized protein LOC109137264 [Larimichthys crocea]
MSEQRQISSYMENEKNMGKRPSSPTFSMDSLTPEINNIPVSEFTNHTSLDDNELMQCDDLLDKEELTCFNIHENMSLESRSLLSGSWSCSTDSVLSEVITLFDQDVNEVIKAVCQSFFDPENMETEAVDSEVKGATESISTSRLTIGSDKSLSSSSTETVIAEAAKKLVSLVYDEAVKELDNTEVAKTPEDIGFPKTMQSTEGEKVLEDADSLKTLQSTDCEKVLEDSESLKALEDTDTLQRSQGKRCGKVHPAPFAYLDEAVRSPSTDWTIFCTGASKQGSCGSQETTTITSSSGDESADLRPIQRELVDSTTDEDPTVVEKTKAKKTNHFFNFFRNIFSKKNIKRKKKVAVEENDSKWPSFWMHVMLL